MYINKYLAACGIASRRKCEEFVKAGRVQINGKPVNALATEVKPNDVVTLDGAALTPPQEHIYLLMHKPKGCVTTTADELGRKTVMDYLPERFKASRLFPVGRLDYETEGLLLLTTDGDLAQRLTHPRHEISKTYIAKISGEADETLLKHLRSGVELDGVLTKKCRAKLLAAEDGYSRVEVVISEGKNRQVRRMFEALGREVLFLKRTAVGELRLGGMARGEVRELTEAEAEHLRVM